MNHVSLSAIFISFVLAMALRAFPWPDPVATYAPDWVLLLVIFWSLTARDLFGVTAAWIVGLFTDVLSGSVLGQHALSYTLVSYLVFRLHGRILMAPIGQESMFILFLSLFAQLSLFITDNFIATSDVDWWYWIPSLVGAAIWPLLSWVLSRLSHSRRSSY